MSLVCAGGDPCCPEIPGRCGHRRGEKGKRAFFVKKFFLQNPVVTTIDGFIRLVHNRIGYAVLVKNTEYFGILSERSIE